MTMSVPRTRERELPAPVSGPRRLMHHNRLAAGVLLLNLAVAYAGWPLTSATASRAALADLALAGEGSRRCSGSRRSSWG
ncbi:hypothetical protein AB0M32_14590 [Streptomyces sp. NPDC051985]|uniref:hypothetical protein n=1 Tax=Streptomyces sp. NPDC051985 TaxID=3155807 RepID=UPI0034208107